MSQYNLPPCPSKANTSSAISQLLSGVISRYANATQDVPEELSDYQVCESAMTMTQVYRHIYQLSYWTSSAWDKSCVYNKNLNSLDDYRAATLTILLDLRNYIDGLSEDELSTATLYHKRTDSYLPFWYIINGPISDMLTHVGQINSWRRAAGHPCPPFSPLFGMLSK